MQVHSKGFVSGLEGSCLYVKLDWLMQYVLISKTIYPLPQLVSKDLRTASLDAASAYLSPASAVLAAAAAAAAEANGSHETHTHIKLDDQVRTHVAA